MKSGKMVIHGNAGGLIGEYMVGGVINIYGNVGVSVGEGMKNGIIINGNLTYDYFCGGMRQGKIIVNGDCCAALDTICGSNDVLQIHDGEIHVNREVVNYYKELSKQYSLVASKKPIVTEKTKKSFEETEKWRVGQEPLLAIPYVSGGFFLPGITRQVRVKPRNIKTTEYDLPHLLVAIDSSGSMPYPADKKSYAVLAGVCAARSYHVHDSAVGVVNFSGDSFYLPYSRNLDDIVSAICAYQGGGTVIDIDMLKKMLSPEEFRLYEENPEAHIKRIPKEAIKKEIELSYKTFKKALEYDSIDLLMFTDGGISNLGKVLEFFENNKTLNRGTIVLTDHYGQFIPPGKHSNINIYRIDNEEDIPNIVLKDVRKNMNFHATNYGSIAQLLERGSHEAEVPG